MFWGCVQATTERPSGTSGRVNVDDHARAFVPGSPNFHDALGGEHFRAAEIHRSAAWFLAEQRDDALRDLRGGNRLHLPRQRQRRQWQTTGGSKATFEQLMELGCTLNRVRD
jgi:hypothetical protein